MIGFRFFVDYICATLSSSMSIEGDVSVHIREKIFGFPTIAIAVGVAGFVSAIVTMFVDTNQQVPIKFIILISWLFLTALVVLIKIINDLSKTEIVFESPSSEKPIKILAERELILIRKNKLFINNTIVGCYCVEDDFESLIYVAVVSHVQDNFLQVKIVADCCGDREKKLLSTRGVDCMIIRPTIPYEVLELIGVTTNE